MNIVYLIPTAFFIVIGSMIYAQQHKDIYINEFGDVAHTCIYGIQYMEDRKGGIHPLYKKDGTFISCRIKETGEK